MWDLRFRISAWKSKGCDNWNRSRVFLVRASWFRTPGSEYGRGRKTLPATLPQLNDLPEFVCPSADLYRGPIPLDQYLLRPTAGDLEKLNTAVDHCRISVCCERGPCDFEQHDERVCLMIAQ